jgi:hypothetical protein
MSGGEVSRALDLPVTGFFFGAFLPVEEERIGAVDATNPPPEKRPIFRHFL